MESIIRRHRASKDQPKWGHEEEENEQKYDRQTPRGTGRTTLALWMAIGWHKPFHTVLEIVVIIRSQLSSGTNSISDPCWPSDRDRFIFEDSVLFYESRVSSKIKTRYLTDAHSVGKRDSGSWRAVVRIFAWRLKKQPQTQGFSERRVSPA